jgi:hypothetical protein
MRTQVASIEVMARPGRFERPTSGSGDQRSIQLSYGRAVRAPSYLLIEGAHNVQAVHPTLIFYLV